MLASGRYALMLLLFATFPVLDRMLRDGGRPDLDRIVSRTLAYGLLTVLLGLGYAAVVLGLGRLLGRNSSLAVAAAFQPLRRRVQAAVDRRFNRRRHDAGRTVEHFAARLRDQVDLDALHRELVVVVDQTMQPTRASLWLRSAR